LLVEKSLDQEDAMKINRILSVVVGLGLWVVLAQAGRADAAEIKVLCSNGLKAVMEELVPQFEQRTKHKVVVTFGLSAALKRQIEAGEAFDVAVLTPPLVDDLIKQGTIAAETRTVIARSGLGIAIRAGGRKPDISTAEAFKRTLLDAKSITYAREGASGAYFAGLMERLGIAQDLKSKIRPAATAEQVGTAVTRGEVELGVLPVSEILPIPGAELLATFPAEVQGYIVMTAGVGASARQGNAARDLIKFLTAPAVLPVLKAKGMEPG
jgi:molybdate transport system substrate-binding protein